MTGELAAQWVRMVVPSWIYRWLMPVGWLGAVVASVAATGRCSVTDPTVCGPDQAFSLAMVLCFASLVLWWWQPILAAAAGMLFAVCDHELGDAAGAQTAWTIYGVLCALMFGWLVISRMRQRSLVSGLPRRAVSIPAAERVGLSIRLVAAGVLIVVGVAALFVMRWQDHREDVHVRRAVAQTAVVESQTKDGDLVLQLPDDSKRTITMADDYAIGAEIPVLVDPMDTDWIRARAELADNTPWSTAAGGAWVLALLLVVRDLQLRRARPRRLWTGQGLPVRIEPDASGTFGVMSADGTVLLGFLSLELDDEDRDAELYDAFDALDEEEDEAPGRLRREWERTLQLYRSEALLVGDLAAGSWPTIVLGEQVMRPVSPFAPPRRSPWSKESLNGLPDSWDDLDDDEDSADERDEIDAAQELPGLPWAVPLEPEQWWERPAWVAALVLTPVAAWLLPLLLDDKVPGVMAAVLGINLVHFAGSQVFFRVIATASEVRVRSGWFERSTPWRAVRSIDITKDRLDLETAGDEWVVVGGVAADRVQQVAGVFQALRQRSETGLASRRLSPLAVVDAVLVVVCVAVLLLT
ncbi:hypothetical protein ACIA49_10250 [Kribbella sp. NPDC051587]|uniref:hypothetical protein n=1 Tax=Kribbella sp. NPDC051587 TaxID=3364119 RepID=UPI0037939801